MWDWAGCGIDGECGLAMIRHAAYRFGLHCVAAYWLSVQVHHAWEAGVDFGAGRVRRGWRRLLPWRLHGLTAYAVPILLVALASFVREPIDVWRGDPAWKSYCDLVSWNLGALSYSIQAYQLTPRFARIRREILGLPATGGRQPRSPANPGGK